MGIRFNCPNGHKLNVKTFQAGRRGICPYCGTKFVIPTQSTRKSSKESRAALRAITASAAPVVPVQQNMAAGLTGNVPGAASQPFATDSSSSPPIFNTAQTGVNVPPQPDMFSSQQGAGGTAFDSPILPNPIDSTTNFLNSIPLHDASAASMQARVTDPFVEAGDVVWYVRPPSGGQYGPATSKLMRQWLAEGRISPNTLVWREGWRDWQQASDVFHQLRLNYPAADITTADGQYMAADASLAGPLSTPRTPKNMLTFTTVLIILTLIIIVSLFVWAFTSGSTPATDKSKSRTHSTRLELRDTLSPIRLS